MSVQSPSADPAQAPDIQDIILSSRIGCIAAYLSQSLGISPAQALLRFYDSRTCAMLHDKATGLYLYGDLYIADEYLRECHEA